MVNSRSFEDIGNFIFIQDEIEKADLIIIPGTIKGAEELTDRAARLWNEGYAPYIMVTGKFSQHVKSFEDEAYGIIKNEKKYKTEAAYLMDLLVKKGVDKDKIIKEESSVNTFDNAKYAYRIVSDKGIKKNKIIICCKAYHARRALMTFQSVFINSKIIIDSVETDGISKNSWMMNSGRYDKVLEELSKCGKFFMGAQMFGKVFPDEL